MVCCSCNLELERRQDAGIAVKLRTCYANILPSFLSDSSHGHLRAAPPCTAPDVCPSLDVGFYDMVPLTSLTSPATLWSLHFSHTGLSGWSLNVSRMVLPLSPYLGLIEDTTSSGKPSWSHSLKQLSYPLVALHTCTLLCVFKILEFPSWLSG